MTNLRKSKIITLFPSRSKWVKLSVILNWGGAWISHEQCLLLGYSAGKLGLVMVPLGTANRPPQASAQKLSAQHIYGLAQRVKSPKSAWRYGDKREKKLTDAVLSVRVQLVAYLAGAVIAAEGVDAHLLAILLRIRRALVKLCKNGKRVWNIFQSAFEIHVVLKRKSRNMQQTKQFMEKYTSFDVEERHGKMRD